MDNNDSPWQYKPDGQTAANQPDLPNASSSKSSKTPNHRSNKVLTWTASEYINHSRGPAWYLALVTVTVLLSAGVWLVTKDYFASVVIIVLGIILAIFSIHKPKQIPYELSSTGLKVGEKNYPFSVFKSFAIIKEGSLYCLNLMPTKRFMPPLSIYFEPEDEKKIMDALGEHLPYEEGGLDPVERLARRLRL